MQSAEAIKWITGIGETLSGKLLMLKSLDMDFSIFEIERRESLWKENFPVKASFTEL